MIAAHRRPPHGGYPTPGEGEVPERRRRESMRLHGHPGAAVYRAVTDALIRAGDPRPRPRPPAP
jgi:hypothetical protein